MLGATRRNNRSARLKALCQSDIPYLHRSRTDPQSIGELAPLAWGALLRTAVQRERSSFGNNPRFRITSARLAGVDWTHALRSALDREFRASRGREMISPNGPSSPRSRHCFSPGERIRDLSTCRDCNRRTPSTRSAGAAGSPLARFLVEPEYFQNALRRIPAEVCRIHSEASYFPQLVSGKSAETRRRFRMPFFCHHRDFADSIFAG
jgi:hypothetical protein